MSLVKVKREGTLFPKFVNDFFGTDPFQSPSIIDFDENLFGFGLTSNIPSVNITEDAEEFRIELAAPGLEKKDFKVEISNGILSISAERKDEQKEERENYYRREFSYQNFRRSFSIPENTLSDKIEASYDNGILELTLPKKEVSISKPKKEIEVA